MNTKLNKSDYTLLILFFTVSIAIQIYDYYIEKNVLLEYFVDIPATVITTLLQIAIFMYWLIPEYIVKQKKRWHFVGYALLSMIILGLIEYALGFWSGGKPMSEFPINFRTIITGISRTAENIGLVFGLLLAKKYYEGQTLLVNVQKQQKENELKLLRSQLDPHFLFNNLNTLDALIDSNPTSAKEYINRLSLIYRYLIKTKDAEVMELSKEVDFAENYVFLIETRFANDYRFNIVNNTSLNDKFIPTGALQTLLENVVKHNKMIDGNTIETTILIEEDWITVTNTNTSTESNPESLGTGLINLKQRYQLLSDKQIQISDTAKSYKIIIPIIKLSDEK